MWKGQGAGSASRHDKENLEVTGLCKEAILQVAVRPACDGFSALHRGATKKRDQGVSLL